MVQYSIYSWNVNGIRAAVKKGFLEWLLQTTPDILCIQETKAHTEQLTKKVLEPPGYKSEWHSANKKGYSGVANFYKSGMEPLSTEYATGIEEFDTEGRIIRAEYPEFTLFNVYFPNGKKNAERLAYKMRFYEYFYDLAKQLLDEGKEVIICGDVNTAHKEIDLEHPKPNSKYSGFLPEERAWIDKFLELGFIDSFRHIHGDVPKKYTWWSQRSKTARPNNVGWRIDYFYLSKGLADKLTKAEIHPDVQGSDHCPISITLKFE